MRFHSVSKSAALLAVFVLVGAGCTSPFATKETTPLGAEATVGHDTSGRTFSEQADIIVEAALDEGASEEKAAGDVESDASLFAEDEQELDEFEESYEDDEL